MVEHASLQTPAMAIPIGHKLQWYEILSVLGSDGFGITYLARDLNLGTDVALKEYLPKFWVARSAEQNVAPSERQFVEPYQLGLASFISEARSLAKSKHTSIVKVLLVFEQNDTAYMAMEHEPGTSLDYLIKTNNPPPSEESLKKILFSVSDGLKKVHDIGLLHKNINASNITIRKDGTPLLIDFGSSRQIGKLNAGEVANLVTQGYAPAEQYSESFGHQGPWSDIYSLSASLYYAISGAEVADALQRMAAIQSGQSDPFRPLSVSEYPAYSEKFIFAINNALGAMPEDRPQSLDAWWETIRSGKLIDKNDIPILQASKKGLQADINSAADVQILKQPSQEADNDVPVLHTRKNKLPESDSIAMQNKAQNADAGAVTANKFDSQQQLENHNREERSDRSLQAAPEGHLTDATDFLEQSVAIGGEKTPILAVIGLAAIGIFTTVAYIYISSDDDTSVQSIDSTGEDFASSTAINDSSSIEPVTSTNEGNPAPEPVTSANEDNFAPEPIDTADENNTAPEPIASVNEDNSPPDSITSADENTSAPESIASINEDNFAPEPIDAADENTAAPETIASVNEDNFAPEPIDTADEDTAAPEPIASVNEDNFVPEPIDTADEATAAPETIASIDEDNAAPEPIDIATEDSSTPEPFALATEGSSTPESIATATEGSSTPESIATANEGSSTPEPIATANEGSSTPEPIATANEGNSTPEPIATANEGSSTPEPIATANEGSSTPEPIATANEDNAAPESIAQENNKPPPYSIASTIGGTASQEPIATSNSDISLPELITPTDQNNTSPEPTNPVNNDNSLEPISAHKKAIAALPAPNEALTLSSPLDTVREEVRLLLAQLNRVNESVTDTTDLAQVQSMKSAIGSKLTSLASSTIVKTDKELSSQVADGLVRSVGVSADTQKLIADLIQAASTSNEAILESLLLSESSYSEDQQQVLVFGLASASAETRESLQGTPQFISLLNQFKQSITLTVGREDFRLAARMTEIALLLQPDDPELLEVSAHLSKAR